MDSLSGASSVIALVNLSAKVASLCFQYFSEVNTAREDISRLHREVTNLEHASKSVQQLIHGPHRAKLESSQQLSIATQDCQSKLQQLHEKLRPKTARRAIGRLGAQTLKWPFQSKDVEHIIQGLERCTRTMHLLLQVDQTNILFEIDRKTVLDRLPVAKGASFDSHEEEHNRVCLQTTRVDLLQQISTWAADPRGKTIFWLSGMAGTGKSTIARTVAHSFAKGHHLGASFFFKRGETDRGGLTKFFSTTAADLIARKPAISLHMKNAIDADPAILRKAMQKQFDTLILEPLSKIAPDIRDDPTIVVVDALDECERQDDIKLLIHLFSHTHMLETAGLRIFLTSRPELPIRLGFSRIEGTYQDLVLHQVPEFIVHQDISVFLEHELSKVRDEYNASVREDRRLPASWPGLSTIGSLSRMASPLFISAATVCRFIADRNYANPDLQLKEILQIRSDTSQLDATYLPVLNKLIIGLSDMRQDKVLKEFRHIIGAIIILADPLSTSALAQILNIRRENIDDRLDMLHSVLSIPSSAQPPVRLLHLSFRDFLLDPNSRGRNPFWIDEKKAHQAIAIGCLRVVCDLRQDICGVVAPGTHRSAISAQKVNACLSPEVQYACLYWVYHLQEARNHAPNSEQIYGFLTRHFLHWNEALSLIGRASESVRLIMALKAFAQLQENTELLDLLNDAARFILAGISAIDAAPLQIYSSLLAFAPTRSTVRLTFKNHITSWISLKPQIDSVWSQYLQTLEDHSAAVNSVAFSHDSTLVASASSDETVRIWRADMNQCVQSLKGHNNWVQSVAFSHDSSLIASASGDVVRICRVDSGECIQTLKGHGDMVNSAAFSHDSKLIASGSNDKMIRIWHINTGDCIQTLRGHRNWVRSVAFSHDSTLVASGSDDKTIRIWRAKTGECMRDLKGHSNWVRSVAFSHESTLVASASDDRTIRVWCVSTGECKRTLKGHGGWVNSVTFSHDSTLIASASDDKTIRIWCMNTGECLRALEGHSGWVNSVAFSHDSTLVASASNDTTIRIWCVNTDKYTKTLEGPNGHSGAVNLIAFSHGSTLAASASNDKILIWRVNTGECTQTLEGPRGCIGGVDIISFSQDSMLVAASGDNIIVIWHVNTGEYTQTLEGPKGHSDAVKAIAFSHNSTLVAAGSNDGIVRIWYVNTGKCKQTFTGHSSWINSTAFSCDSMLLGSASNDKMIRIWSVDTGECIEKISVGITTRILSFEVDNTRLLTTHGSFTMHNTPSISSPIDTGKATSIERYTAYSISQDKCWITVNGENTLWLPVEFRPCCWAVSGSSIVIGCESGRVIIIGLSYGANRPNSSTFFGLQR